jgi:predicted DCC family thiol-disulfide oxidoreductase YuxK/GNAT superfamily N-acetyltransferase
VRYTAPRVSGSTVIRLAQPPELPLLQRIEREASTRFRGMGLLDHLLDHSLSLGELSQHQRAGRIWVAVGPDGQPVGFAVANVLDGAAHLEELDVVPEAGRQGIGRRLLETVSVWAAGHGFSRLTLSTFRDVPWNEPFYRRAGFTPLDPDALSPALRAVRVREAQLNIPMDRRVIMARPITPAPDAPPLHLVLYDGECGLCSRVVRSLIAADRRGVLHFAPLQGSTAAELRNRHDDIRDDPDSVVYVDRSGGGEVVSDRAAALIRLGRLLGGRWGVLAALLAFLPRPLADAAYDVVAGRRHRFGRGGDVCALAPPAVRARFLP